MYGTSTTDTQKRCTLRYTNRWPPSGGNNVRVESTGREEIVRALAFQEKEARQCQVASGLNVFIKSMLGEEPFNHVQYSD